MLHEIAKSWLNGTVPATDSPWKLWNSCPPTLIADTHGTGVSGVTPGRQQPEARHHLERRPGRQPTVERGVERGVGRPVGHREDLTGGRPDRDQRRDVGDVVEPARCPAPSRPPPAPWGRWSSSPAGRPCRGTRQLGLLLAGSVLEHDVDVGRAGEPGLVLRLEAGWPDQRRRGVAGAERLELVGGDRGDPAEQRVGEGRASGPARRSPSCTGRPPARRACGWILSKSDSRRVISGYFWSGCLDAAS